MERFSPRGNCFGPTKTCRSIFKKFSFPDPLHWEVIEMSVETQMERFGPVGNFVWIEQRRSIFPWLVPLVSDQWKPPLVTLNEIHERP